jgi:hypothetical protein
MEKIYYGKTLAGIRIRRITKGSNPITDGKEAVQIVTLKHPKGKYLAAHKHEHRVRTTQSLQECLFVKKGKIRLDLYTPKDTCFKRVTLTEGDAFLLISGGVGIHIIENSELIEVKNGPFVEDKVLITP